MSGKATHDCNAHAIQVRPWEGREIGKLEPATVRIAASCMAVGSAIFEGPCVLWCAECGAIAPSVGDPWHKPKALAGEGS